MFPVARKLSAMGELIDSHILIRKIVENDRESDDQFQYQCRNILRARSRQSRYEMFRKRRRNMQVG